MHANKGAGRRTVYATRPVLPQGTRDADRHLLQEHVAAANRALGTVRTACRETKASSELKAVLAALLAAGNCLNFGTKRGAAAAIKLDMLSKLADVKVIPCSLRTASSTALSAGR